MPPPKWELSWLDRTYMAYRAALRSADMGKLRDEASSPALWATLGTAIPLIGQFFTSSGNATLAATGGILVAVYSIAVQLKNALLAVPPPGSGASADPHPAMSQVSASLASASAATASAAATLPATVKAAENAVDSLHGVADSVAELVRRANDAFYNRVPPASSGAAPAPAAVKSPASPAPTTLPPFKAGNPPSGA